MTGIIDEHVELRTIGSAQEQRQQMDCLYRFEITMNDVAVMQIYKAEADMMKLIRDISTSIQDTKGLRLQSWFGCNPDDH
jgi:hypothetical protein